MSALFFFLWKKTKRDSGREDEAAQRKELTLRSSRREQIYRWSLWVRPHAPRKSCLTGRTASRLTKKTSQLLRRTLRELHFYRRRLVELSWRLRVPRRPRGPPQLRPTRLSLKVPRSCSSACRSSPTPAHTPASVSQSCTARPAASGVGLLGHAHRICCPSALTCARCAELYAHPALTSLQLCCGAPGHKLTCISPARAGGSITTTGACLVGYTAKKAFGRAKT